MRKKVWYVAHGLKKGKYPRRFSKIAFEVDADDREACDAVKLMIPNLGRYSLAEVEMEVTKVIYGKIK